MLLLTLLTLLSNPKSLKKSIKSNWTSSNKLNFKNLTMKKNIKKKRSHIITLWLIKRRKTKSLRKRNLSSQRKANQFLIPKVVQEVKANQLVRMKINILLNRTINLKLRK